MLEWAHHPAHCPGHTASLPVTLPARPVSLGGRRAAPAGWLCPRHAALTRTPPILNLAKGGAAGAGRALGLPGAVWRGGWGWSKDEGLPCPLCSRPPSSVEAAVCWSGNASQESTEPSTVTFWVFSEEGGTGLDGALF